MGGGGRGWVFTCCTLLTNPNTACCTTNCYTVIAMNHCCVGKSCTRILMATNTSTRLLVKLGFYTVNKHRCCNSKARILHQNYDKKYDSFLTILYSNNKKVNKQMISDLLWWFLLRYTFISRLMNCLVFDRLQFKDWFT